MSALGRIGVFVLLLGVSACSTDGTDPAAGAKSAGAKSAEAPVESAPTSAPAGFAPVGPGAEINPERQFTLNTVQSGGQRMLTVGADGVVTLTDHLEDRALFVATPVKAGGDKYLLRTAKLVEGGEPWCLYVNSPGGTEPLNLKTTACDAGKEDQIFTFPKTADGKGRLIEVGGLYALADGIGGKVVVQESGEGDAMSAFTVRDQGKSTLPALD